MPMLYSRSAFTSGKADREPCWWSMARIVQHADRLGIPNFQRGAVWDQGNLTALLESMYEQSPCGSFVLWAPEDDSDPRRHGVPIRSFGQAVSPMWLVDGQQRTRAILDTFEQMLTVPTDPSGWALVREAELESLRGLGHAGWLGTVNDDETDSDDDGVGSHFWGVVVPAMRAFDRAEDPYFGPHSESRNVRRGSMFRRLSLRVRVRLNSLGLERSVPPIPVGVVPLATLLAPAGIFHDTELRSVTEQTLRTFQTGTPDLEQLDELVPWGPQFVTGHAYERPAVGDRPPTPMRWADLHARRDGNVSNMVELLAGLFGPRWRSVFDAFNGMREGNRFAVGWLPPGDVSAAIDAYVRINRAGIRVRSEERALARLSRACPGLLDGLAHFVSQRDGEESTADQRSLLVHESERQMGFAVWMSTVTRYSALALSGTAARRWLGTSAIDNDTFGFRLDRVGPNESSAGRQSWAREYTTSGELIQECSERATDALLFIDSVLSDELLLDHRMARPSTRPLMPLIDIFYRLPGCAFEQIYHDKAFRSAVARLLHWTLLVPYIDEPNLKKLIIECHGIDEAAESKNGQPLCPWHPDGTVWQEQLRQALSRYQSSLASLWEGKLTGDVAREVGASDGQAKLTQIALHAFETNVRDARSLQHAAVGWLYAIERRGKAREFLWRAQFDGFLRSDGKVGIRPFDPMPGEAPLGRANDQGPQGLYPEKQHIVPFTYARRIVDKGGTRATSSPANAIGNLTWLSQRQNRLDALADRWTVMDRERDGENLGARGLLAEATGDGDPVAAITLYEAIQSAVGDKRWRQGEPEARRLFDAFCQARARWMLEQMRNWLEEPLSNEASAWLGGKSR